MLNYEKIRENLNAHSNYYSELSDEEIKTLMTCMSNIEEIGIENVISFIRETMEMRGFGDLINYDNIDPITLWESYLECKKRFGILES